MRAQRSWCLGQMGVDRTPARARRAERHARGGTCPVSTGGGTRRVRLVREGGEGGGGGGLAGLRLPRDEGLLAADRSPGGREDLRRRRRFASTQEPHSRTRWSHFPKRDRSQARGAARRGAAVRGTGGAAPPPPPRNKWTRRVPHPVLIGHAGGPRAGPRACSRTTSDATSARPPYNCGRGGRRPGVQTAGGENK